MIITIGDNQKGYTIKRYDPDRETIFFADGLSWDELTEEMNR